MDNLKKMEKSISINGILYAFHSFPITAIVSLLTAIILGIDHNECIKCQENGNIWFLSFAITMVVFGYFSYNFGLKLKIKALLKNGQITRSSLSKMNLKNLYIDMKFKNITRHSNGTTKKRVAP